MFPKSSTGKNVEGLRSASSSLIGSLTRLCRRAFAPRYRPELHYMRGPRAKAPGEDAGQRGKPGS